MELIYTAPTLPPNPKEKKMNLETEYNQKWYRQPPHHWVKLAVAILLGLLGAVGVIAVDPRNPLNVAVDCNAL